MKKYHPIIKGMTNPIINTKRKIPAIYFLYSGKTLIYIGRTKDLKRRISAHKIRNADSFRFIKCGHKTQCRYENRLIRIFRPLENLRGKDFIEQTIF